MELYNDAMSEMILTTDALTITRKNGWTRSGIFKVYTNVFLEIGRKLSTFEEAIATLPIDIHLKDIHCNRYMRDTEIWLKPNGHDEYTHLGTIRAVLDVILAYEINQKLLLTQEKQQTFDVTGFARIDLQTDNSNEMPTETILKLNRAILGTAEIPNKSCKIRIDKNREYIACAIENHEYKFPMEYVYTKCNGGNNVYLHHIGMGTTAADAIVAGESLDIRGVMARGVVPPKVEKS